ncbi:Outer membrane usher protein fimD [Shigella dysenteriae WRSd3]|uniref:Outer membrane usher protein fimD n=2 Tax=Shigella dysenteriae TaxID=622 RepID=A0A090NVQ9_SHIDY|nr:fimbria/pilus outer membrane usher protein [Shigella dysenteriae]AHA64999.1 Outer membrane usher protein fimD [Shigella dysenteriae 1617]ESU76443.1 Outer membrane usher protein fimD [Shigella dysenteriae WRSd3]
MIRSDFPVVVIRSGFQNLSLSSFIIGLCMTDIGWLELRSRLTVGDSYTDGDIFDNVNFRGGDAANLLI